GAVHKIRRLADLRNERGLSYRIEVDGGIALDTVGDVVRAGAEILVAGNAVFGHDDPKINAAKLMKPAVEATLQKVWLSAAATAGETPALLFRGLMLRRIAVFILLATLAFTVACTNKKVNNPLANVGSKQPDKVLFDRAMDAMKHNRFDVARITLQTLINTYPDSEFIARAKLAVADSWYAEGGSTSLAQAEAEYKDFETFFPNMPEAAEAQVKIANIHYQQMEKPDR